MDRRGALIVVEGCDNSGKTTLCNSLVSRLRHDGEQAENIRYPDRTTPVGKLLDAYLKRECEMEDHAVHLLFTANRWETVPRMMKALCDGTTLIADRYAYSGIAYSSAKIGVDRTWCETVERGVPRPDAVLFLDVSPDEVADRSILWAPERYETTTVQRHVYSDLNVSCAVDPATWHRIDAHQRPEVVLEQAHAIVVKAGKDAGFKPVGSL